MLPWLGLSWSAWVVPLRLLKSAHHHRRPDAHRGAVKDAAPAQPPERAARGREIAPTQSRTAPCAGLQTQWMRAQPRDDNLGQDESPRA